jgi:O-antigen/teichoic acid export membrane protein
MRHGFLGRAVTAQLGWSWPHMKILLQLAIPLGVVSMLASINANVPRYFLEAYHGHAALGIFSPIASLLTAGALIVSSMGQAAFVPVAQAYDSGDVHGYRKFIVRAIALAGGLGIAGIVASLLIGREVLGLLFGDGYRDQVKLLVWLAFAGSISFAVSGLGYIMTAARTLNPQVPLLAASSAAALGGSMWLIPKYGLAGAAWVVAVSAFVQLSGTFFILFHIDRKLRTKNQTTDQEVQLSLVRSAEGGVR